MNLFVDAGIIINNLTNNLNNLTVRTTRLYSALSS